MTHVKYFVIKNGVFYLWKIVEFCYEIAINNRTLHSIAIRADTIYR